ncbi:MAG: hypothetical protein AB3A66_09360 [Nodularia sp. CChRGM 3473]
MEMSAVNSFNGEENTSNVGNLFAGGGSQPQRSPFENLNEVLNENLPVTVTGSGNPIPGSGIDPFAGDLGSQLNQVIFERLKLILGENFFDGVDNPFVGGGSHPFVGGGTPPFNQDNVPVGNGNRNFGSDNATIGNFNSDFGNDSATIGNGNWNFSNDNATIGNGNWLFASDNTTLGNGNWYWDYGNNNATLGNGNWQFDSDNATIGNGNWGFGNNNTTIGNGNWDFGNNNTIVGNGNWVFTNDNTVVGNGNWLFNGENTIIDNGNWLFNDEVVGDGNITNSLELYPQEIRADVDNLIDSLVGRIGQDFLVLTGDFGVSETETFNRLILAKNAGSNNSNISTDIEQFLASLGIIPGNANYPVQNPQSVPEFTPSASLVVVGLVCLLLSKFKKGFCRQNWQ